MPNTGLRAAIGLGLWATRFGTTVGHRTLATTHTVPDLSASVVFYMLVCRCRVSDGLGLHLMPVYLTQLVSATEVVAIASLLVPFVAALWLLCLVTFVRTVYIVTADRSILTQSDNWLGVWSFFNTFRSRIHRINANLWLRL